MRKVAGFNHRLLSVWIAWFLIFVVLLNYIVHIIFYGEGLSEMLWYCNLATLMLAVGILRKNALLISIPLITAIPAQGLWIIDFFLQLFGGGLGRTAHLFVNPFWVIIISVILHGVLIPSSIYATFLHGFSKKSLFWACIFIAGLMVVPYFVTSPAVNINCVFYPCDLAHESSFGGSNFGFIPYTSFAYVGYITLLWFVICAVSFYTLSFIIQNYFKQIRVYK